MNPDSKPYQSWLPGEREATVAQEARERLRDAAPKLLAVLRRLCAAYDADAKISPNMPVKIAQETNAEAHRMAHAAIAQATGEEVST